MQYTWNLTSIHYRSNKSLYKMKIEHVNENLFQIRKG
jgi:hypothetical protein